MFNINDTVWIARFGTTKEYITCPHCLGNKYLTCILGDNSQVTFDCECCREGFGYIGKTAIWQWAANAEQVTITGIESNTENGLIKTRYHVGCSIHYEVFATRDEAMVFAQSKVKEHEQEEKNKLENLKDHARRTWAWNVTYHRNCIKNLEKDLEYHKLKLAVAETKVKKQA